MLNKFKAMFSIAMAMLVCSATSLSADCRQPSQGPQGLPGGIGATGPAGPTGSTGATGATGSTGTSITSNHIFSYNAGGTLVIAIGGTIPFNTTSVTSGSSITQPLADTFVFTEAGDYLVNFVGYTAGVSLLGTFSIQLNGVDTLTSGFTLITAGANLPLSQIVRVTTPGSVLQVVGSGLAITLASGISATIDITQLSTL